MIKTTAADPSPRYYHNPRDAIKQLPQLLPIVPVFLLTVFWASGLKNETTKTIVMYFSLVYPVIILFSLSFSIPKMNYYRIDSEGIHVTILRFFHRHIRWADVESIGPAAIGNVAAIGVMYTPAFSRYVFGRKSRRRMWGWDELLSNAHTKSGASFDDAIVKYFKKHLSAK